MTSLEDNKQIIYASFEALYFLQGNVLQKDEKIVRTSQYRIWSYEKENKKLMETLISFGYARNITDRTIDSLLGRMIGKSWDECVEFFKIKGEEKKERRQQRRAQMEREKALPEIIKNYTCGVAKDIDFYNGGFTVTLLTMSTLPFEKTCSIIKGNTSSFVDYVVAEIKRTRAYKAKIRDIRFYCVRNIIVTRRHEVEFKFELKPGIENILSQM